MVLFSLGSRDHGILCFQGYMACLVILVFYLKSSLAVSKSCKLFPLSMEQELGFVCTSAVCLSPSGCPHCLWHSSSGNNTRPSICTSLVLWAQNTFSLPSDLTISFLCTTSKNHNHTNLASTFTLVSWAE